jgi:hypothetical protein
MIFIRQQWPYSINKRHIGAQIALLHQQFEVLVLFYVSLLSN